MSRDDTVVGTPMLSRAKILVEVQEQSKTEKIILFQRNSKKRKIRKCVTSLFVLFSRLLPSHTLGAVGNLTLC
jgi:hypothetical protein